MKKCVKTASLVSKNVHNAGYVSRQIKIPVCLVLINSHLFPMACGAGSTVPRKGFFNYLSVIILASLLVCPMLGCHPSLLRLSNNFTFFTSRMQIFIHSYLYTLTSRGHYLVFLALTFIDHFNEIYCFYFPSMYPTKISTLHMLFQHSR